MNTTRWVSFVLSIIVLNGTIWLMFRYPKYWTLLLPNVSYLMNLMAYYTVGHIWLHMNVDLQNAWTSILGLHAVLTFGSTMMYRLLRGIHEF